MAEHDRPNVEDFSRSKALDLDLKCNRFECAWQAVAQGDPRPQLEDFLVGTEDPQRLALLRELIALEVYYRQQQGEQPTPQEYQARFPSLDAHVLGEAFASEVASQPSAQAVEVTPTVPVEVTRVDVKAGGERIGEYDLLQEIARGGMGVVYRARHTRLDRVVALKMILSGHFASQMELERFRSEAANAAHLDHPHIVPLYEVGEHQGLPYFCMKFLDGGTLAQHKQRFANDPRQIAHLLVRVAEAVHHAHQRGILHRDLKPANILLDEMGQPHVTDFGLAKRIEGEAGLTQSGAIVGTPGYLAPEQARGQASEVTTAADVWGLGAILYELLTLQPPFRAETPLETVLQALRVDPTPPSRLRPEIPRDLETICLKCLHKEPDKRYPSAEALAEDLHRWQAGEPIKARPTGNTERFLKWVKRRPALAGLLLTAVVLFVLVGLGGPLLAWYQANLRQKAENQTQLAEDANRRAQKRAEAEERAKKRAEKQTKRAEKELYRAERQIYLANLRESQLALNLGDYATALARLAECRWDFRGWEYDHLFTRLHQSQVSLHGHARAVRSVAFSPDGRLLASASGDGMVTIWDALTGQETLTLRGHTTDVRSVRFSLDGKRIVCGSADKTVKIWDVRGGQVLRTLRGHRMAVNRVGFSPDGQGIFSASTDGTLKIWDANKGQPVHSLRHAWAVESAAFSPDGQRIVSGGYGNPYHLVCQDGSPTADPSRPHRKSARGSVQPGWKVDRLGRCGQDGEDLGRQQRRGTSDPPWPPGLGE